MTSYHTIRFGCLTLFASKAVLLGSNRLFESPTFEYMSLFIDVTITVAYYVRISRHLSCRLSGGTRCWEKISFTLNTLLLYAVLSHLVCRWWSEAEKG